MPKDTHSYPTFASIRQICVKQQVAMLVVTDHLQMLRELPHRIVPVRKKVSRAQRVRGH